MMMSELTGNPQIESMRWLARYHMQEKIEMAIAFMQTRIYRKVLAKF
jgi:hypothetical protein